MGEIVNTEQAAAWDGHEGDLWAEHADRYERAGRRIGRHIVDQDLVGRADRVLDIGCGTGASTRAAAAVATAGEALGIDLSSRMLEMARRRSEEEGLDNVRFVRADAQVVALDPGAHDLAISSFGAMFFGDPVAAFENIGRGLRPGGSLALLAWRSLPENDWLMALRGALALGRDLPQPPPDAPTPFSLADPERVHRLLGAAGFDSITLEPIDEMMELGADAADALEFAKTMGIVEGLTDGFDPGQRAEAMTNLADLFAAHQTDDGVLLASAAWLIRAERPA